MTSSRAGAGGAGDGVDLGDAGVERLGRGGADGAAGRHAHVGDDDVGAGAGHGARLVGGEDVGRGQEVEGVGGGDHVDLEAVAHAGLLEGGAHGAVEEADGGEVLHAGEAEVLQLAQEGVEEEEGVGAVDAGEDRGVADDGEHLGGHLLDDLVGVAEGEEAGGGAAAGHAVAAGVVDDDEVDAAGLLALGREAGAGAAADDGLARGDEGLEALEDLGAGNGGHDQPSVMPR